MDAEVELRELLQKKLTYREFQKADRLLRIIKNDAIYEQSQRQAQRPLRRDI